MADTSKRSSSSTQGLDPDVVSKVEMRKTIGGLNGANPLTLSMPVMITLMSYGALKRRSVTASSLAGIAENTGEGGMSDTQREAAEQLIFQCLGGHLGRNIHDMNPCQRPRDLHFPGRQAWLRRPVDGQESDEGAAAEPRHSRPYRSAFAVAASRLLRRRRSGRQDPGVPRGCRLLVSVKMGAGRARDDINIAVKDSLDFHRARRHAGLHWCRRRRGSGVCRCPDRSPRSSNAWGALDEINSRHKIEIVLMGGICDAIDGAKALALGADAFAICTSITIAAAASTAIEACRPVRDRHRDPGHREREALQPPGRGTQFTSLPRGGALADRHQLTNSVV